MPKWRKVIPYRESPWPGTVIVIEPEWEHTAGEDGTSLVTVSRWLLAVTTGTTFFSGSGYSVDLLPGYVCDYICRFADESQLTVVIAYGMFEAIHLLDVSGQFRHRGWRAKKYVYSSHVCVAEVRRDGRRILWLDMRNWVCRPLSEIADWVGETLPDLPRFWPGVEKPPGYHETVRHVLALAWNRYVDWVSKHSLGGWTLSLGSLSYQYWSRSIPARKVLRSGKDWVIQAEREGYYGGFVYAPRTGLFDRGPYYLLDCNGLYATVMREEKLPYIERTTCRYPGQRDLDRITRYGEPLVYGRFALNEGYLPVRIGRKLTWSHGPVDIWLPWPEVAWVMQHGRVERIHGWVLYLTDHILRDVTDYYWGMRRLATERGDRLEARLWKLAANTLYGKFGQRWGESAVSDAWEGEEDTREIILDAPTGKMYAYVVWCGSSILTPEEGESRCESCAIAAWITSHARVRLWQLSRLAGWDHIYYWATDSIIVDRVGYDRLADRISETEPGRLKLVAVAPDIEILAPNRYRVGDLVVDSGTPSVCVSDGKGGLVWYSESVWHDRYGHVTGGLMMRRQVAADWGSYGAWRDTHNFATVPTGA